MFDARDVKDREPYQYGEGAGAEAAPEPPPAIDPTCSVDCESSFSVRRRRAPSVRRATSGCEVEVEALAEPLDDHGHALATTNAHRLETERLARVLESV